MERLTVKQIRSVAEQYGTPCFLAFPNRFRTNLTNFRNAFEKYYDRFVLSYSFKTNYTPFLLKTVKEMGGYAEVVSDMEYDLALQMGFSGEHIILNGPIKRPNLLRKAIINKSIIQLDSEYEVDSVIRISKELSDKVQVGLRVNMEINTDGSHSAIQAGLKESRFGFPLSELKAVVSRLKEHKIKIISLHGHTSTTNRVVENYQIISQRLLEVCKQNSLDDICYLDIGGGFFGAPPLELDVSGKPTYLDYAKGVCDIMLRDDWFVTHRPYIVIEPGTSVVANVFELLTQIYQHKNIKGHHFVFVDATISQVRPARGVVNYPFEIVSNYVSQPEITADIVGATCMEVDIISNQVKLSHYHYGDLLVYKAVGAYRINMFPIFILYKSPIVIYEDGDFSLYTRRQDIAHFMRSNMEYLESLVS